MADLTSSAAFRTSGREAFAMADIAPDDVAHLMLYDAFARLPIHGPEDLGFCKPGEARHLIKDEQTAPGGKLPVNANGGGASAIVMTNQL